jgi:transcriptional repressor NrdR
MRCPKCGCEESKVVDSRPSENHEAIRRRRECLNCEHRFTTYERLGDTPLLVTKSDGSSETYDRSKLIRGVTVACAKRPITPEQITSLIDSIEAELRAMPRNEITSKELGTKVLERLESLDDVAYVRFASVYKDFQNIEEFAAALEELR